MRGAAISALAVSMGVLLAIAALARWREMMLLPIGVGLAVHPSLVDEVMPNPTLIGLGVLAVAAVLSAPSLRQNIRGDWKMGAFVCGWALASSAYFGRPLQSAIVVVPILGALAALRFGSRRYWRLATMWIVAHAVVASGLAAIETFILGDLFVSVPLRAEVAELPRAAAFTGSTLSLAYLCAWVMLFMLSSWAPNIGSIRGREVLGYIVVFFIVAAGLLATWSLGAWGVVVIGALAIVSIDRAKGRTNTGTKVRLVRLASLAAALTVVAIGLPVEDGVLERTDLLSLSSPANSQRLAAWNDAAMTIARQGLFGSGFEYYAEEPQTVGQSPESWYLLLAREGGLPLALLYLAMAAPLFHPRRLRSGSNWDMAGRLLLLSGMWIQILAFPILGYVVAVAALRPWASSGRHSRTDEDLVEGTMVATGMENRRKPFAWLSQGMWYAARSGARHCKATALRKAMDCPRLRGLRYEFRAR